jgi:hypothetical protein
MTSYFLFFLASAGSFLLGRRSLTSGIGYVIAVGYVYGIIRANFVNTYTHLMFDGAVAGLYLAQLFVQSSALERRQHHDLRMWVVVLVGWPTFLLAVSPGNAPLVELVGWRANVFLLPFLLLGARLSQDDLYDLAKLLAVFNIAAAGLAAAEFMFGIDQFFPRNELTEIIFKSTVLEDRSAFRIPSSFSSAHAYAGTIVLTLPLLIGGWIRNDRAGHWHTTFGVAIVASLLGIAMAAARVHTVVAALILLTATFSGGIGLLQRFRWAIALGLVVWVVGGDVRLQRFTSLSDTSMISERVSGSVNEQFFEVISDYPLGNGLASGGTSVPYFLQNQRGRQTNTVIENDYARLALEQGWPGLLLWVGFIAWALSRRVRRESRDLLLMRRLAWVTCAAFFASGLIGLGMLSAVPQTTLMLLTTGWLAVPVKKVEPRVVSQPVELRARAV